nr:hypothetical protein [Brucella intermedia]
MRQQDHCGCGGRVRHQTNIVRQRIDNSTNGFGNAVRFIRLSDILSQIIGELGETVAYRSVGGGELLFDALLCIDDCAKNAIRR